MGINLKLKKNFKKTCQKNKRNPRKQIPMLLDN